MLERAIQRRHVAAGSRDAHTVNNLSERDLAEHLRYSRREGAARRRLRWLPGLLTLRRYELAWLRHDIAAGLVLTTMLVPVGIAYAVASVVPGI